MQRYADGSWELDLGGVCFRELEELGELLKELGEKGEIARTKFDLETLRARFDAKKPEVYLLDDEGNTTQEENND